MESQYETIYQQVKPLLGHMLKNPPPIEDETDLIADLGLDSLKVMELMSEVEDCFDISYPLNDLHQVRTVKDLVTQIEQIIEHRQ